MFYSSLAPTSTFSTTPIKAANKIVIKLYYRIYQNITNKSQAFTFFFQIPYMIRVYYAWNDIKMNFPWNIMYSPVLRVDPTGYVFCCSVLQWIRCESRVREILTISSSVSSYSRHHENWRQWASIVQC